ncbi:MAG: hypothetical protein Q9226_002547 [Calogaya cf. arnoldii]
MLVNLTLREEFIVAGLEPPAGQISDFTIKHSNIQDYNVACQVLCLTLVGICMLARIYTRSFIKPPFQFEDCNAHYAGVHQWNVPQEEVAPFIEVSTRVILRLSLLTCNANMHVQLQYFGEIAYYLAAFMTKISILWFIIRVFKPHRRAILSARIFMGLMALYYLPALFFRIFRCNPVRKTWDPAVEGTCVGSEKGILYFDCVVSLLTDIAIFGFPVPLVWKLQTSVRRKLRILLVFASGMAYVRLLQSHFIMDVDNSLTECTEHA